MQYANDMAMTPSCILMVKRCTRNACSKVIVPVEALKRALSVNPALDRVCSNA